MNELENSNESLLTLLSKLISKENNDNSKKDSGRYNLDKLFDKIFKYIEDYITPVIIKSSCPDKYEIIRLMKNMIENYHILSKLPELLGKKVTVQQSSTCYFNSPIICIKGNINIECINSFEQRVVLEKSDMNIIKSNSALAVPVKVFIYTGSGEKFPDNTTVKAFIPYEPTNYSNAIEYFVRSDASKTINIRSAVDAFLQRAFQYFDDKDSYISLKLGELNKEIICADDKSIKEYLSINRTELLKSQKENSDNQSELKKLAENLYLMLDEVRLKLIKLSEGRIPDTKEQIADAPHYIFDFNSVYINGAEKEDYDRIEDFSLKTMILASYGNIDAVRNIAFIELEGLDKSIDYFIALWNFLEKQGYNPTDFEYEKIGKAFYNIKNYKKANEFFKKSGTGASYYYLGQIYEYGYGYTVNLKTALTNYKKAQSLCYPDEDKLIDKIANIEREIARDQKQKYYTAGENYSSVSKTESHDDGCFVTTAVCQFLEKPDDCYELNSFRAVRDNWLRFQPNGIEIIEEYYRIAPLIISEINLCSDSEQIYHDIWKKSLKPALAAIEINNYSLCVDIYTEMVSELAKKYDILISSTLKSHIKSKQV